jgi:hypothetical protein
MKFSSTYAIKIASLILLTTIQTVAVAHPGHGGASELSHSLEHLLWLAAGVSAMICAVYYVVKNKYKN